MFRVMTCNVNGIRSAARKNFDLWLQEQQFDVICLQEIRLQEGQWPLLPSLTDYHRYVSYAQRKGYSGVAIYSKQCADTSCSVFDQGKECDFSSEGRYICCQYPAGMMISVYFPSGSSSEVRQEAKIRFLDRFITYLRLCEKKQYPILICGDLNIAHQARDLKNWYANQNKPGFLPEERQWLDELLLDNKWYDIFRVLDQREQQYTWWSNRGKAWVNNVGWRIDYQIGNKQVSQLARHCSIYKEQRFSDHAPLIIEYAENFLCKTDSE